MKTCFIVALCIICALAGGPACAQRCYVHTTETLSGSALDVDLYLWNTSTPFVPGTSSFVIQYDSTVIMAPQLVPANDGPWSSGDPDYWALSSVDHATSGYVDLVIFFNGGRDNTGELLDSMPVRVGTLRFSVVNPSSPAVKTWRAVASVTQVTALANPGIDAGYRDITDSCAFHTLDLTAILQGPYAGGVMGTQLRAAGYVPAMQPYGGAPWNHAGTEYTDSLPADVVDWVLVELRSGLTGPTKVASQAALLRSNGTITAADGSSVLGFRGIESGEYNIVLRHRNHLGAMSAVPMTFGTGTVRYDFTSGLNKYHGGDAREVVAGVFGLWAGDVTGNGVVKYSGSGNDRSPILTRIGGSDLTLTVSGYYPEDVNMNGQVKYSGSGNDRSVILQAIGGSDMTVTRSTKVPN